MSLSYPLPVPGKEYNHMFPVLTLLMFYSQYPHSIAEHAQTVLQARKHNDSFSSEYALYMDIDAAVLLPGSNPYIL